MFLTKKLHFGKILLGIFNQDFNVKWLMSSEKVLGY